MYDDHWINCQVPKMSLKLTDHSIKHRMYFGSRDNSHIFAKSNNLLITGSHAFPDPDNIDADTPAHTLPWKSGDRIDIKRQSNEVSQRKGHSQKPWRWVHGPIVTDVWCDFHSLWRYMIGKEKKVINNNVPTRKKGQRVRINGHKSWIWSRVADCRA